MHSQTTRTLGLGSLTGLERPKLVWPWSDWRVILLIEEVELQPCLAAGHALATAQLFLLGCGFRSLQAAFPCWCQSGGRQAQNWELRPLAFWIRCKMHCSFPKLTGLQMSRGMAVTRGGKSSLKESCAVISRWIFLSDTFICFHFHPTKNGGLDTTKNFVVGHLLFYV